MANLEKIKRMTGVLQIEAKCFVYLFLLLSNIFL